MNLSNPNSFVDQTAIDFQINNLPAYRFAKKIKLYLPKQINHLIFAYPPRRTAYHPFGQTLPHPSLIKRRAYKNGELVINILSEKLKSG